MLFFKNTSLNEKIARIGEGPFVINVLPIMPQTECFINVPTAFCEIARGWVRGQGNKERNWSNNLRIRPHF
jgi:hypothetical protein